MAIEIRDIGRVCVVSCPPATDGLADGLLVNIEGKYPSPIFAVYLFSDKFLIRVKENNIVKMGDYIRLGDVRDIKYRK